MDLTPLTAVELNVSRSILDTNSRLFLLEHAAETSAGYTLADTGVSGGEVLDGWFMQRNRFGEWILEIACNETLTVARMKAADAIGYNGLLSDGSYTIFEIRDIDPPRSASDRTALFRLSVLQVIVVPEEEP